MTDPKPRASKMLPTPSQNANSFAKPRTSLSFSEMTAIFTEVFPFPLRPSPREHIVKRPIPGSRFVPVSAPGEGAAVSSGSPASRPRPAVWRRLVLLLTFHFSADLGVLLFLLKPSFVSAPLLMGLTPRTSQAYSLDTHRLAAVARPSPRQDHTFPSFRSPSGSSFCCHVSR